MRTNDELPPGKAVLDKRRLQALGVLLPIQLHALSFLSGRHPLKRPGDGMRFLRTRPYEPGHDNPRDIDKFSPSDEYWVNEWEAEAQAAIRIYGDVSASMSFEPKAAVRNTALLQLTYSLWRASDRVRVNLYSARDPVEVEEPNLKSQLEVLADRLRGRELLRGQDAYLTLQAMCSNPQSSGDDLAFVVSDFCPLAHSDPARSADEWRTLLRRMHCDLIPVIVSFELLRQQRGTIKLWDPERQKQRLTLLTPRRIDRINDEEARRVAALEALFRGLGVDYLTLRTERDVYPGLARLARARRRRRM